MGVSDTQIDLSWEAPAGFAIGGYRIEVSTDGGMSWTDRVADTESTDTDYSHSGLTDGDTRHYRVSTNQHLWQHGPAVQRRQRHRHRHHLADRVVGNG